MISNPSVVVDATTGRIFVFFNENASSVFVCSSSDDGLTWSIPSDITNDVKVTTSGNPNPSAYSSSPWGFYATGPGHGIQIQNGPYAGRLVISAVHRLTSDQSGLSWSHIIYSDDHGLTWHLGGGLDQSDPTGLSTNENSIAEEPDGSLYMTIRLKNSWLHGFSVSHDGGMTWTTVQRDPELTTSSVEASILRIDANTVILSSLDDIGTGTSPGTRHQLTIWVSYDNMLTWVKAKVISYDFASYSDMTLVGPDTVLLAYDGGRADGIGREYIALARFNLAWLQSSTPPAFTWYFNEQDPGQAANISGPSIQDASPWDNRANAQAASPAEAPTYVAGLHAGDSALRLTTGSDDVQLTPAVTNALQFGCGQFHG